jgi:ABC-type anion transport system duplicated permease subunit
MIAETLAGIALVKSAVDGIKSAIGTANDIGEIASHIDDLFLGEQQAQKARNKKSSASQFNVNSVAKETIDAKLAAEKLYEVSVMVDQRFGHGTWQNIINERARRIQEAKEVAKKERMEQNRKNHEMMELAKTIGISVLAVIFAVSCIVLSMMFAGP